jgi:mono/diheme cytochrome c family protein
MSERRWAIAGKILTALAVLSAILIAIAVVAMLQTGVSARTGPTWAESMVARTMRHFAVPAAARSMRNPVPLTPAVLAEGRAHFADHCAGCHANDGSGATDMGQNLYPKPPDMRKQSTQRLSDGEIFFIIKDGVRLTGMPAWGDAAGRDDQDTWELVHFIRRLPAITPQELEEMKRLNPVSHEEAEEKEFLEGSHETH